MAKKKASKSEEIKDIAQQQAEEWSRNIGWLVEQAPTDPKAEYCLNIVMKYVELVDYTKALAEQYEVSTKYLEAAIEQIKMLKLELVTIAARQAEQTQEAPPQIKKGRKRPQ